MAINQVVNDKIWRHSRPASNRAKKMHQPFQPGNTGARPSVITDSPESSELSHKPTQTQSVSFGFRNFSHTICCQLRNSVSIAGTISSRNSNGLTDRLHPRILTCNIDKTNQVWIALIFHRRFFYLHMINHQLASLYCN